MGAFGFEPGDFVQVRDNKTLFEEERNALHDHGWLWIITDYESADERWLWAKSIATGALCRWWYLDIKKHERQANDDV